MTNQPFIPSPEEETPLSAREEAPAEVTEALTEQAEAQEPTAEASGGQSIGVSASASDIELMLVRHSQQVQNTNSFLKD